MKNLKILGLFSAFLFSTFTSAGVLIEPFVGFAAGSGDYARTGATTRETKETSMQFGGRLGYQFLGLMGGLEYRRSSGSYKFDGPSTLSFGLQPTKADYSGSEFGVFVGYNFPILARVYLGYAFNTKWEIDTTNSWRAGKGDEISGSTTTLGVGFTGLPFVSINFEYRMIALDKWKDISANTETVVDENINQLFVGISLPLDI
ncbi:hypothetical protein A9Q84_06405 [Halobacteriovorax marinus]|uniref:Uncharacterized protein n=1 Tax=Halobacteriovorax marinus TaxID=97084 RepID=A0A1Y5F9U7_9BACT|nr:hypothetical protein A9Q84_06405 [Halobacteriovorax marinus]